MLQSQREVARACLGARGMLRLAELREAGVTAATLGRMREAGEVRRLARGLYQLADAQLELHHDLAEAAKRVPKGGICLVSALSFHELTLELPGQTWVAIGAKDWAPAGTRGAIRTVRYADRFLQDGIATRTVEKVPVKVFDVPRT